MKKSLRIACMAFLICTCFSGMALAKEYRWNTNSVWPPNNHLSVGLEEFSQKVAEKTGGTLDLVVQSGGALGFKGPELLKAVRDGLLPVSDMLISGVAGDEPVLGVVTLPFLVHSFERGKAPLGDCPPLFRYHSRKEVAPENSLHGSLACGGALVPEGSTHCRGYEGVENPHLRQKRCPGNGSCGGHPLSSPLQRGLFLFGHGTHRFGTHLHPHGSRR